MENISCGFEVLSINSNNLYDNFVVVNTPSMIRCNKGWAKVSKNDVKYKFSKGAHFMVYENSHIRILESSNDFECTLCLIESSFLTEVYPFLNTRMWSVFECSTPDNCRVKQNDMLNVLFNQLIETHNSNTLQFNRSIALFLFLSYLHLLYNELLPSISSDTLQRDSNTAIGNNILDKFFILCSKHYTEQRSVEFYANKLHISTRHLYNITITAKQVSPKAIIDSFVIGAIKNLLITSSLSVQEISAKLNFPDQSTLRQYFKRNTGVSPSEYRNSNKQN